MSTLPKLLNQLKDMGVLSKDDLSIYWELAAQGASTETFIDQLVVQGRLTKYQASVICNLRPGKLVIGNYIIVDKLGAGGMGVVYKAFDRRMHREVAIKMLLESGQQSEEKIERFRREAIAAARMNHPNIVTAYAANEHEGYPYLVMEYVKGRDLGSLVKKGDKLPVPEAVNYMLQAAEGVAYAHSRNIIHRDLKPSNLLLTTPDDSDIRMGKYSRVKILDMGLGQLTQPEGEVVSPALEGSDLSATGMLMGTVDYMAPEQAMDNKRADQRSDIYSLGCTLYFLMTKRPVYSGSNLLERISAHLKAEIPSLKATVPEAPEELDAVFQKMVAKKPKDRYQTMSEVVDELRHIDRQLSGFDASQSIWQRGANPDSNVYPMPGSSYGSPSGLQGSAPTIASGSGPVPGMPGSSYGNTAYGEDIPSKSALRSESEDGKSTIRGFAPDDNVQFTVYAPRQVCPEKFFHLLAFAHLDSLPPDASPDEPDPLKEVQRQADEILGHQTEDYRSLTQESNHPVPRDGELTFLLDLPGFQCNPPSQSIYWAESVHRICFRIKARESSLGTTCRGRLSVFLGALLLADVNLRIEVRANLAHMQPMQTSTAKPYRKIFASYSRLDTKIVKQFEHYAASLGDKYLRDVVDLRSGENWNEGLLHLIQEADVFQLFWSSNSMHSDYVRQEWEFAMTLGRANFIRPTYWEDPFPEVPPHLPPETLRQLHFQQVRVVSGPTAPDIHHSNPRKEPLPGSSNPPFLPGTSYGSLAYDEEYPSAGTLVPCTGMPLQQNLFVVLLLGLIAGSMGAFYYKYRTQEPKIIGSDPMIVQKDVPVSVPPYKPAILLPSYCQPAEGLGEEDLVEVTTAGGARLCYPVIELDITELPNLPKLDRGPNGPAEAAKPGDTTIKNFVTGEMRVRFRLIPASDAVNTQAFYMMENKVWSDLFRVFAESQSHRIAKDNPWTQNPPGKLPAYHVSLEEAYWFARWMGGRLPSAKQWDVATGFYLPVDERTQLGPYKLPEEDEPLKIAVKGTPTEVDAESDDISPFEIRNMAGNGMEFTRNTFPGGELDDEGYPLKEDTLVTLRGKSFVQFDQPSPLSYKMMLENTNNPAGWGIDREASSETGFRVVLETSGPKEGNQGSGT